MVLNVNDPITEDSWSSADNQGSSSDSDVANTSTGSSDRSATPTSEQDVYEKPVHSYVALISMAILSSASKKLMLGDIYDYIQNTFPYYKHMADKAWRNSVRHNLSLNECFVKSGRAEGNKGHYWSIHSNCIAEFAQGDYRRRQARRRTRRKPASSAAMPNISYVQMTSFPTQHQQQRSHVTSHHQRATGSPAGPTMTSCYYAQRHQPYSTPVNNHLRYSASMRSSVSHVTSQMTYEPTMTSLMNEALVAPPNVNLPQALAPQVAAPFTQQIQQMTFNFHSYPSYNQDWTSQSTVPLPTYIDEFSSLQGTNDLPSLREALLGLSALAN